MKSRLVTPPARPFFLKGRLGDRFCLYHAPPDGTTVRAGVLYVPPFGEEMNKSRRMAAQQARALAASGFGVLQIDLYGCGDSSGELRDVHWHDWHDDLALARDWMEQQVSPRTSLWCLRLGCLLALDFLQHRPSGVDNIVLWQPVVSGKTFLTQLLRMKLANYMLTDDRAPAQRTDALRHALASGQVVEVAGYDLTSGLTTDLDRLDLRTLAVPSCPVHWLDITSTPASPPCSPVPQAWTASNVNLRWQAVTAAPFWMTPDIPVCPPLISATVRAFEEQGYDDALSRASSQIAL